jgi:hypothetical protein
MKFPHFHVRIKIKNQDYHKLIGNKNLINKIGKVILVRNGGTN